MRGLREASADRTAGTRSARVPLWQTGLASARLPHAICVAAFAALIGACGGDEPANGVPDAAADDAALDASIAIDAPIVDGAPSADAGPDTDAGLDSDGGSDSGPSVPCTPGTLSTCAGDIEMRCVGGALVTRTCALGCSTTDATRCAQIVPSNVPADAVMRASGEWIVTAATPFDSHLCMITGVHTEVVPQATGAPDLCVVAATAIRIHAAAVVTVTGDRALVLLSAGDLEIEGSVDVSARLDVPGPGGFHGGSVTWSGAAVIHAAEGPSSGGEGGHVDPDDDAGGGGGGLCGAGGTGASAGGLPAIMGGLGGYALGAISLSPLQGGSGGARGRGRVTVDYHLGGAGGAGGGALQLVAYGTLRIAGRVVTGGGGGAAGTHPLFGTYAGAGGGGGSGGGLLLEGAVVELSTAASLDVSGGGGGGGSTSGGPDGDNGVDGVTGGMGGAGAFSEPGGDGAHVSAFGETPRGSTLAHADGSGGGGGAGCIVVHVPGGIAPLHLDTQSVPAAMEVRSVAAIAVN